MYSLQNSMAVMTKNRGFTFIEIIISLFIISIMWIPILALFSRFRLFTEKIKLEGRSTEQLISLDDYIRRSISRIQPPYWIAWEKDSLLLNSRDHLCIPYWKGKSTAGLEISCSEGMLHIVSPDGYRSFNGWNGFESTPMKTRKGSIIGVVLILKKPGKKDTRFICPFGTAGHAVFEEAEK